MTKERKCQTPTPTKGKGGGKGSGKDVDIRDCPMEFKKLAIPDNPKYTSLLKKEGEGIGLDDLDSLQFELESLLLKSVVRRRYIIEETDILQNIEKHRGRAKKIPSSPGKRTAGRDSSTSSAKKIKLGAKTSEPKPGKSKAEAEPHDPLENEQIKPALPEPKKQLIPKNDTPHRFWSFVEPYCAPIQLDDVKFLEDMIKGYTDMNEYLKVPPLGPHYSIRWAKEDLENERGKSSEAGGEVKVKTEDSKDQVAAAIKKEVKSDSTPFGELTQRLIQGLMEEKVSLGEEGAERSGEQVGSRNSFIQSLRVAGEDSLEKQIKKELEEQGILDPNEEEGEENDEILAELERCQAELRAVSAHNHTQLKRLVKLAREEMSRQEIRNKLAETDEEVKEAYTKIAAANIKKRSPTKKEKDTAWKSIKDREAIIKQLESV